MKSIQGIFLLSFAILLLWISCEDSCNDCLEITTKSIQYVNVDGDNLLFGNTAIYNPENILVRVDSGETIDVRPEGDSGSIAFDLEGDFERYRVFLPDASVDELVFELTEKGSMRCCGNVIASSRTFVNGQETDNDDLVTIVR